MRSNRIQTTALTAQARRRPTRRDRRIAGSWSVPPWLKPQPTPVDAAVAQVVEARS